MVMCRSVDPFLLKFQIQINSRRHKKLNVQILFNYALFLKRLMCCVMQCASEIEHNFIAPIYIKCIMTHNSKTIAWWKPQSISINLCSIGIAITCNLWVIWIIMYQTMLSQIFCVNDLSHTNNWQIFTSSTCIV